MGGFRLFLLGGTVAMKLFIILLKNLSKQKGKEMGSFPVEPTVIIYLIHFLPQPLQRTANVKETFSSLALEGIRCGMIKCGSAGF